MKEIQNIIDKHTEKLNNMKANRAKWEEEKWTDAQIQECDNMIQLLASILSDLNKVMLKDSEVDTKTQKISRIKEIIGEWGSTTTAELEADSSPCISSSGTNRMNVSTLVEGFYRNHVNIVTYNNETEIADDEISYEELSEDVIDDILGLLEDYDVDMQKTMDSTRDEDF